MTGWRRNSRAKTLLNALEAEAGFAQGVADRGDMGCAAGFNCDVDDGFAQADAVVGTVVNGFNDIGALPGQNLRQLMECAGPVLQVNTHAEQTAILDQAALDNLGEQGYVDVAAADEHESPAMAQVCLGL